MASFSFNFGSVAADDGGNAAEDTAGTAANSHSAATTSDKQGGNAGELGGSVPQGDDSGTRTNTSSGAAALPKDVYDMPCSEITPATMSDEDKGKLLIVAAWRGVRSAVWQHANGV